MIESIKIQNRQSHEDTEVLLHPGVNVIVGRGTSGKSAILRAFRWPLENTAGTAQISRWIMREPKGKSKDLVLDGETSVTITKPDGTLRRFRNVEANGYEVNGKTLKAVGVAVPDEVKAFFNLSDVNIQGQFDPPFLISLPGSQVSAYLNRVVGIEDIDRFLTASTSCIREVKKEHKALLDAQEQDRKAIEALSWVEGIQGQVDALQTIVEHNDNAVRRMASIKAHVVAVEEQEARAAKSAKVAALETKLAEVRKLAQAVVGVGSKLSSLVKHIQTLEATQSAKAKAAKVAKLSDDLTVAELKGANAYGAAVRLDGLKAWIRSVRVARESSATATAIAALEPQATKVRKISRGLAASKAELESVKVWCLTMEGLDHRLKTKRAEVSTLEAQRPESCPLCGGAYGKECSAAI